MTGGIFLEIALIFILMLANGFFAASEIAVVSSRKGRLEQRGERGERGAAIALELAESPNRFLSTVQVGITLISTLAAAFGGASLADALTDLLAPLVGTSASTIAFAIVVVLLSYFSLIIGELVPKRLALQNPEAIATRVSPIMRTLARFTAPVVTFLTFSTEMVLRLLGRHGVEEMPITEDDVIAVLVGWFDREQEQVDMLVRAIEQAEYDQADLAQLWQDTLISTIRTHHQHSLVILRAIELVRERQRRQA